MDFAVRAFQAVLGYQNSAPLYVSDKSPGRGRVPRPPFGPLSEIIIERTETNEEEFAISRAGLGHMPWPDGSGIRYGLEGGRSWRHLGDFYNYAQRNSR